jgi:hypothetical protein
LGLVSSFLPFPFFFPLTFLSFVLIRAVKSNCFRFDFRPTWCKNLSIRFRFDIDSIRYKNRLRSHEKYWPFGSWPISKRDRPQGWRKYMIMNFCDDVNVITKVHYHIILHFPLSQFMVFLVHLSVQIESNRIENRKFHSIRSAFDSIWYQQKLSIR